jgi:hypothetical protein
MITLLTVIGVAAVSVLLLVSLKRQGTARSERKQAEADRHSPAVLERQEESRQRRADVRAAHKRRAQAASAVSIGSDADE